MFIFSPVTPHEFQIIRLNLGSASRLDSGSASRLGYTLIADPGGRCNLLVATCNLLVGICNMLVDMLYNLLFNKHTFRVHKRDNDRYFAVLTIDCG